MLPRLGHVLYYLGSGLGAATLVAGLFILQPSRPALPGADAARSVRAGRSRQRRALAVPSRSTAMTQKPKPPRPPKPPAPTQLSHCRRRLEGPPGREIAVWQFTHAAEAPSAATGDLNMTSVFPCFCPSPSRR